MSNEMITHKDVPVTLQREHKARLNHVEDTKQLTQATLDANGEIHRHGLSVYCHAVNDSFFWVEALQARTGDKKIIEVIKAEHQKWIQDFQASNSVFFDIYGTLLQNIIRSIPPEPRDVGFWEEIASRINALLFDNNSPKRSKIEEIQMLVSDAKEQLSSASKAHLQELKTVLEEMAS